MAERPAGPHRRQLLLAGAAATALGWSGAACPAGPASDDPMQPGISLALARRRAAQIGAVQYDLTLDLTDPDRARGTVATRFDRRPDSGDLVLDWRGPAIADLTLNGEAVPAPETRGGHLLLPARLLRTGGNLLSARFETPIAAAGAAIIRFHDEADGRTYLYTLLVPSDANLLFPCFDQPDLKARFRWQLTAPAAWTVVANGTLEGRKPAGAATRWRFAPTEPISTYLAAFAAGPWASWTSPGAGAPAGERPISLYARASRRAEVDADAQLATNRAAVRWLAAGSASPSPSPSSTCCSPPRFRSAAWSMSGWSSTTRTASSSASRRRCRSG